jgi:hypothetical protein
MVGAIAATMSSSSMLASGSIFQTKRMKARPMSCAAMRLLRSTSDDQDPNFVAMMTFRHASVGTSSRNRVAATSRLLLPLAAGKLSRGHPGLPAPSWVVSLSVDLVATEGAR